jgi:hypothetical protein
MDDLTKMSQRVSIELEQIEVGVSQNEAKKIFLLLAFD